jgi:hypothetical protein
MCCYFRAVDRVVLALIIYQAFIYQEVYYVAWKATLSKYSILYSNWNGAIVLALIILCTKLQYTTTVHFVNNMKYKHEIKFSF